MFIVHIQSYVSTFSCQPRPAQPAPGLSALTSDQWPVTSDQWLLTSDQQTSWSAETVESGQSWWTDQQLDNTAGQGSPLLKHRHDSAALKPSLLS